MGYVDKEIARQQKLIGDAVAGKGLRKAIRALQEKSQIKGSLKDLPARGAITAKRKNAKPVSGTLATERRTLLSSDGIFSLDYYHVLGVNS